MADLAQNAERFRKNHADLAVIGSGDPGHFTEFREITGYRGLLFSDPPLTVFSALGFSKGLKGFMSVGSLFKAAAALKQGHRQGRIQGSTLQLGGAVVVGVSGEIRYYYSSRKAGAHPSVGELLMAVKG